MTEPSLKLLIVDDDEVDRMIITRGLSRGGLAATVVETESAQGALDLVARQAYDCVILDYHMPGGDGLTLLRGIKGAGLSSPVIMLTGQGDELVAVELMKSGAADYIPKSALTPERLTQSVRTAVELARAAAGVRRAQEDLRRREERARFLADASVAFARSLDTQDLLERVTGIMIPELADYALGYLVSRAGEPIGIASAHADPTRAAHAALLAREYQPLADNRDGPLARAIHAQEVVLVPHVSEEALARAARTPELRDAFTALAPQSGLFIPLIAREHVIGAIALVRSARETPFSDDDRAFADEITTRAALALDNVALLEEARAAHARTQRLQDVTAKLAGALTAEDVGMVCVTEARSALDADTAWISLVNEDATALRLLAHAGYEETLVESYRDIPLERTFPAFDLIARRAPLSFESKEALIAAYPAMSDVMERVQQEAVLMVPLEAGSGPFGAMALGFREPRKLCAGDRALIGTIGQQAAQALERSRLYQLADSARREAEEARREAEEANLAKSQFLARMSHDLRTPLNAIGGYCQLLELGIHGPILDAQRDALGRIQRAQAHLLTLINDILSFARLEAGQVHITLAPVPVNSIIEEIRGLVAGEARTRGLGLETTTTDAQAAVIADRARLAQILMNLAGNALKFTARGSVALSASSTPGKVHFQVSDTGRGIPAARLEHIFDPFVQVHASTEQERDGIGLGLAISAELAKLMNGELTVESEEGRGSRFTLTLPLAPVASGTPLATTAG